jgi:hypothetical protein
MGSLRNAMTMQSGFLLVMGSLSLNHWKFEVTVGTGMVTVSDSSSTSPSTPSTSPNNKRREGIEAFPKNFEQMVQNRLDAINVHGGAMCFGESVEFTIGVHPATGGTTHDMSASHLEKFTNDKTGLLSLFPARVWQAFSRKIVFPTLISSFWTWKVLNLLS